MGRCGLQLAERRGRGRGGERSGERNGERGERGGRDGQRQNGQRAAQGEGREARPVEGRENTEPVWSPSATRFSAPTSHYYHRRRQVSSGLGIFRLSAARKFDPTRNRTPASWMANHGWYPNFQLKFVTPGAIMQLRCH